MRRGLLKAYRHGLLLTAEGMRTVEDLTVSNDEDPPPLLTDRGYPPKCLEQPSEKSLRCVWNNLKRSPLTDFLAPYWPNAWLGALLKPLFGQSLRARL